MANNVKKYVENKVEGFYGFKERLMKKRSFDVFDYDKVVCGIERYPMALKTPNGAGYYQIGMMSYECYRSSEEATRKSYYLCPRNVVEESIAAIKKKNPDTEKLEVVLAYRGEVYPIGELVLVDKERHYEYNLNDELLGEINNKIYEGLVADLREDYDYED